MNSLRRLFTLALVACAAVVTATAYNRTWNLANGWTDDDLAALAANSALGDDNRLWASNAVWYPGYTAYNVLATHPIATAAGPLVAAAGGDELAGAQGLQFYRAGDNQLNIIPQRGITLRSPSSYIVIPNLEAGQRVIVTAEREGLNLETTEDYRGGLRFTDANGDYDTNLTDLRWVRSRTVTYTVGTAGDARLTLANSLGMTITSITVGAAYPATWDFTSAALRSDLSASTHWTPVDGGRAFAQVETFKAVAADGLRGSQLTTAAGVILPEARNLYFYDDGATTGNVVLSSTTSGSGYLHIGTTPVTITLPAVPAGSRVYLDCAVRNHEGTTGTALITNAENEARTQVISSLSLPVTRPGSPYDLHFDVLDDDDVTITLSDVDLYGLRVAAAVSLNQYGYRTYVAPVAVDYSQTRCAVAAHLPVTAYSASYSAGSVRLVKRSAVVAGTPVLLVAADASVTSAGSAYTAYVFAPPMGSAATVADLFPSSSNWAGQNDLVGNLYAKHLPPTHPKHDPTGADYEGTPYYVNFVLSRTTYAATGDHAATGAANDASALSFYQVLTRSGGQTLPAAHAFLQVFSTSVPSAQPQVRLPLVFADADATEAATSALDTLPTAEPDATDDAWYTPDGRRLPQAPLRAGLYIHNAKKIYLR